MVRLILYNLQYLSGGSGKIWERFLFWRRFFHPRKIEEKIAKFLLKNNPDVLAFIEVDTRSFNEDNYLEYFQEKLKMKYCVEKKKYHFVGLFKFFKIIPFLKNTSNAILSRKKLRQVGFFYFKHGIKRAIIKTSINIPKKVNLFLVHLSLGKKTRKKQIWELAQIIKKVNGPSIVMGDFNLFGGEKEIENFLKETGLRKNFDNSKKAMTFPACHPSIKLDYILVSPEVKVNNYKILSANLSDHLPVLMDFSMSKKVQH